MSRYEKMTETPIGRLTISLAILTIIILKEEYEFERNK